MREMRGCESEERGVEGDIVLLVLAGMVQQLFRWDLGQDGGAIGTRVGAWPWLHPCTWGVYKQDYHAVHYVYSHNVLRFVR